MNIVWLRNDGGISVTHLIDSSGHTPEQHAEFLKERGDIPNDWVAVEFANVLPDNRHFRNAWAHNLERGVHVNLEKARELTKERLRRERTPLLAELDILYMRALEKGCDTSAIVAEKQRLRDITAMCDIALIDELSVMSV